MRLPAIFLLLATLGSFASSTLHGQLIPIPPPPTTNVLVGPFVPGSGSWTRLPNGGFETGDLSGEAGYRENEPFPGMGTVQVHGGAAYAGAFGATLTSLGAFQGPGITLEYRSGFNLLPSTVYVVSAFLRVHSQTSTNARIYLDLWDVPGDPAILADRTTTDWQFVWGLFDSRNTTWVGFRVVADSYLQEGDSVDIDEIAITPLESFQLPSFTDGRPLPPVAPIPPPKPLSFSPAPGLYTNQVSIALLGGGYGAEIRYTTDGSAPATNSALYKLPLQFTNHVNLKAQVFTNGIAATDVLSGSWLRVYAVNDGISAAWRQQYFGEGYATDPRVAFDADPDNDGASNLQEFTNGSDPTDPLSGFGVRIRAVPQIRWTSVVGQKYRILHKRSLSDPEWQEAAVITATSEQSEFTDTTAAEEPGYYLVQPILPKP